MGACTFFGHRDCPGEITPILREVLIGLIANHGVDMFYVGNQGRFDAMVRRTLRELQVDFPHIRYAVVLAYMPGKRTAYDDYSDTMFPEGVESIHPRYAISWRNNWMLWQSDFVVTYITHSWGGAAQYTMKAEHSGKAVINLALCGKPEIAVSTKNSGDSD